MKVSAGVFSILKICGRNTSIRTETAIEKIRAFIDATIISTDNVSAEGTELQKTVDLEENRYMLDKLSHKLIEKLT